MMTDDEQGIGKKIKLLFVDDEESFLRTMATRLKLRDFEVTSFTSGFDALEAARQKQFDVALLDLKMPGIDGEELLREIKKISPDTEVIILTGHGSVRSAVNLTRQGAYEYLQKPCDFDELMNSIIKAFTRKVKAQSSAKSARVEELINRAVGLSPLSLLQELKKIDKE